MNKRSSFIFAIFDLYRVYTYTVLLIGISKSIPSTIGFISAAKLPILSYIPIILASVLQIILILSIFASGILYLLNKKIAYYMYFPQFVLRLLFVMPTFGIILSPVKYNAGSTLYKVLLAVCIILEIGRLAATIFCLIKDRKSSTI